MNEELEKFRVWPDGTVQQVFEPESIYSWMSDDYQRTPARPAPASESIYSWMSDDYQVVEAVDEEDALRKARLAK